MPRICAETRLVSHNGPVWFQKPLNQCSVERFAILSFFYDNSQCKHKFKGIKREGMRNTAFCKEETRYTEERKKHLKIFFFFLKTNAVVNNSRKVIYLELSYYRKWAQNSLTLVIFCTSLCKENAKWIFFLDFSQHFLSVAKVAYILLSSE